MLRRERGRRPGDEDSAEADADHHPERGRDDGVHPPLGRERAHEVGAAHADGAGHPHLRLALGREHHEQVHEQEQPGEDAEAAHGGEHGREALARRVGGVEQRPLRRVDLRVERRCGRDVVDRVDHRVGAADAALDAAAVGDGDRPRGRRA